MDLDSELGNLSLTRRVGERVFVGDNVIVTITEINRHNVKLSIRAPRDVAILREEIKDRVRLEQEKHYK